MLLNFGAQVKPLDAKPPIPNPKPSTAKRENTKPASSARETLSADDILREVLSELNTSEHQHLKNVCLLDGAAIRAGRAKLESKISGIFVAASSTDVFLSADISGWSPRIDVELELEFADSLMFCYGVPSGWSTKDWWKDITIACTRAGAHNLYHDKPGRKVFWGFKQLLHKDPQFGEYLATAPTRAAQYFPMYRKTVGSAWQS